MNAPRLTQGSASVRVPATTANLGPGFDSLGLALALHDRLEVDVIDEGLKVEVEGVGAETVPRDESHLVVQAMWRGFEALGVEPSGLHLRCSNRIPHARGLGSSSAAIVAGLGLASALVHQSSGTGLDDHALVALATEMEGHPDNVAPAVLGGFVIAGADEKTFAVNAPLAPEIRVSVLVPAEAMSTEVARNLLPERVPHTDAATNAGRAALLVAAMAGQTAWLLAGTGDLLHQRYRAEAMPDSVALVGELRSAGHAAFISGAGPSVAVLHTGSYADSDALADSRPHGWTLLELMIDLDGMSTTL